MERAKIDDIKKIYAAQALRKVFNAMPEGYVFYGWELKEMCVRVRPELKNMYVETFLKTMRRLYKNKYTCTNPKKSMYMKVDYEKYHKNASK